MTTIGEKIIAQIVSDNSEIIDWTQFDAFQEPRGIVIFLPFREENVAEVPDIKTSNDAHLTKPDRDEFLCSPAIETMRKMMDVSDRPRKQIIKSIGR